MDQLLFVLGLVLYGILGKKLHSAGKSGHFLDGHLKEKPVFFADIGDKAGIRGHNAYRGPIHRIYF